VNKEPTMDSHSRWDEVKAKRRSPSEAVRASVEREFVEVEPDGAADGPRTDSADGPDAPEA
jgi:hypothetical protein